MSYEGSKNPILDCVIEYLMLEDADDIMYKKGEAKTEARLQKEFAKQRAEAQKRLERNQRFTVIELLDAATLTEEQIKKVFEVTSDFIQDVKNDLLAAPKKITRLKKTMKAEQIAEKLNLPINWIEKQLNN